MEMERYTTIDVIGDLIGLLDAVGERRAVVVGNEWGATIAWQAAALRPDRFRAVIALGVDLHRILTLRARLNCRHKGLNNPSNWILHPFFPWDKLHFFRQPEHKHVR